MMRYLVDGVLLATALFMGAALSTGTSCLADATLSLQYVGAPPAGPFPQGQNIQVKVRMTGVPVGTPAAGFQAFLHFDSTRLSFVSGNYTANPFGLFIIYPITAVGENINLASGTNAFLGQVPSSVDADLAILTFQVTTACGMGAVDFRPNQPPTRLSDALGQSIEPLVLNNLTPIGTCPGDVASSNSLNVADLLLVIANWGACPPTPTCCAGNTNGDSAVNVADLLLIIAGWGPCP